MLHETYKAWWTENVDGHLKPLGKIKFNQRLTKLGYKLKAGTGNKAVWEGIGIICDESEEG
jgi:hypothetical protein